MYFSAAVGACFDISANENGKVDLEKMQIISYDPFNHGYYVVGKKVGQAFSEGRKIK